jgi:TPR repeat protein
MYRNGEGVERNTAIAKELYLKSANLNNSMAIQELIKIYKEENNEKQVSYWSKKYNQLVKNSSNIK